MGVLEHVPLDKGDYPTLCLQYVCKLVSWNSLSFQVLSGRQFPNCSPKADNSCVLSQPLVVIHVFRI